MYIVLNKTSYILTIHRRMEAVQLPDFLIIIMIYDNDNDNDINVAQNKHICWDKNLQAPII